MPKQQYMSVRQLIEELNKFPQEVDCSIFEGSEFEYFIQKIYSPNKKEVIIEVISSPDNEGN